MDSTRDGDRSSGENSPTDLGELRREILDAEAVALAALRRLLPRRKELEALMVAAVRGDLIDRPLAATEREAIRDALCVACHLTFREELRQVVSATAQ